MVVVSLIGSSGLAQVPAEAERSASFADPLELPGTIPAGTYVCATLLSGSISGPQMGTTIGQISIVAPGVYTSMVKEGKGSRARFTYDAVTGKIVWEGGKLAGFFAKVVESSYSLDSRGKPLIKVTYRVRDGGNLFDLSCQ